MFYPVKNKDDIKELEELPDLQSKVKQVRFEEMLGKQSFHYDSREFFEPITKTVIDASEKVLEETNSPTKVIEESNESIVHMKALELMNEIGVTDTRITRLLATLLVPQYKFHFGLCDESDSDNLRDYIRDGE